MTEAEKLEHMMIVSQIRKEQLEEALAKQRRAVHNISDAKKMVIDAIEFVFNAPPSRSMDEVGERLKTINDILLQAGKELV